MIVKYELAIYNLRPTGDVGSYSITPRFDISQFCCETMQKISKRNELDLEVIYSYTSGRPPYFLVMVIFIYNSDYAGIKLSYCPFCGKKFETECIKTIKLKRLEKKRKISSTAYHIDYEYIPE